MDKFKSSLKNSDSSNDIMEMALAFQKSRILLTAYELGLFTLLGGHRRSSSEVAKTLGAAERSTDRLMNALCAMGLLRKEGTKFLNTSLSRRYLVKGSPQFIAGLMHTAHMWDTWSTLTEAVRQGRPSSDRKINKMGKLWLEAFLAAMHERASMHAQTIVNLLDLSDVSTVLDVGGGSGAYSMAFVRARKGIRATVFDLPNVVPITKMYLEKEGFLKKVRTAAGDYITGDLGKRGYDLVFLSAIIHINSFDENLRLIRKCSEALNPKGLVVIQDFIMDEDRTKPPFGAFFALNMLVGTESGDTYTFSEVRKMMERSGLSNISKKDTPFDTSLIIGRKDH